MGEINYVALLPEIILSVTGILVVLITPFVRRESQGRIGYLALAGTLIALVAAGWQWGETGTAFSGLVFQDSFGHFARVLFLFAVGAITLTSIPYLEREKLLKAEYFALLLFAAVGMCLMAVSADLIVTFLGIEVLSVSTYVLAGYRFGEEKSTESSLKYFLLGAFSTAFLLYGIAFAYGVVGSTKYVEIARAVQHSAQLQSFPPFLFASVGLMLVGFGFKAALAPFHVWTPDVYEGAPVPVTAHLAVASKAAAVVALLRILYQVAPEMGTGWQELLWISAVLTMLIGNVAALVQANIKRMLAYSSIAHAGYLLVGLAANSGMGAQGVLFYLLAYTFMNLGAFCVVQLVSCKNEEFVAIEDYAGLGFRYPFLGISLSVFLVSLAGIPLTAGFAGKLFLFSAAVQSEMYWLVVIAVLASAIGVYYYLRILVLMFMRDPEREMPRLVMPAAVWVVIVVMLIGTLYLGIFPGSILQLASEASVF